ncbi:hypothetical protein CAPTEDRAFT_206243 [Capitella teleta]|uniref:Peptidase A2 domain-containing protein n=1 Tax=Capitella teleta TaxID=283909 RepID=R7VDC5_CAPTE|nr:hypothetical protein CAPTEDRAFT_206243 [Capitella teleta]|eukprot:ELU16572.1 hypothetical protein CAPTEDRAFT_206243 [Capitella teleta]
MMSASNESKVNKPSHRSTESDDGDSTDEYAHILSVDTPAPAKNIGSKLCMLELQVCKKNLAFELDTGSSVTIVNEKMWKQHFGGTELCPSSVQLYSYTDDPIFVLGSLPVEVCHAFARLYFWWPKLDDEIASIACDHCAELRNFSRYAAHAGLAAFFAFQQRPVSGEMRDMGATWGRKSGSEY